MLNDIDLSELKFAQDHSPKSALRQWLKKQGHTDRVINGERLARFIRSDPDGFCESYPDPYVDDPDNRYTTTPLEECIDAYQFYQLIPHIPLQAMLNAHPEAFAESKREQLRSFPLFNLLDDGPYEEEQHKNAAKHLYMSNIDISPVIRYQPNCIWRRVQSGLGRSSLLAYMLNSGEIISLSKCVRHILDNQVDYSTAKPLEQLIIATLSDCSLNTWQSLCSQVDERSASRSLFLKLMLLPPQLVPSQEAKARIFYRSFEPLFRKNEIWQPTLESLQLVCTMRQGDRQDLHALIDMQSATSKEVDRVEQAVFSNFYDYEGKGLYEAELVRLAEFYQLFEVRFDQYATLISERFLAFSETHPSTAPDKSVLAFFQAELADDFDFDNLPELTSAHFMSRFRGFVPFAAKAKALEDHGIFAKRGIAHNLTHRHAHLLQMLILKIAGEQGDYRLPAGYSLKSLSQALLFTSFNMDHRLRSKSSLYGERSYRHGWTYFFGSKWYLLSSSARLSQWVESWPENAFSEAWRLDVDDKRQQLARIAGVEDHSLLPRFFAETRFKDVRFNYADDVLVNEASHDEAAIKLFASNR